MTGFAFLLAAQAVEGHPAGPDRNPGFPRELDRYVAQSLQEWEIPGAALAVVKDGRVLVTRGYGVRRMGTTDAVDANTIFDLASLTKGFTAAGIARLVDEGKMAWDAPVRRYLPSLEFPDPYLTANVTLRDLLCHRTGIRPTNYAWYLTNVSRSQLLTLVDSMQSAAPFRTRLAYWNIGYAIAGEAAATVAGTTWETLIARQFFVPLGMARTTADYEAVPGMGNYASGHAMVAGVHGVIPRETARASTAPAGVIHSSASDLARWMLFQLGDGAFEDQRLLSAQAMNEMHSPNIAFPSPPEFRAARQVQFFPAYGLGWQVFDYRGHPLLWHSGNGDGQLAYLALLPDLELGVAVLVNSWRAGPGLNGGIVSRIMDHYLGLPTRDYSAELRDGWTRNQQRQVDDRRALESSRLPGTRPSLPLTAYAGGFRDRIGLDVRVWLEADSLRLQYGGGEPATLAHWHNETFRARWQNPFHAELLPMFVSFGIDARGQVDRLRMDPYGDEVEARRMAP